MISKTKFLYEILIRLTPDGYFGSQAIELERIVDDEDDSVIERELPARAILEADLSTIFGPENAALLESHSRLIADLAAANARAAQAEADRDALIAQAASAAPPAENATPAPEEEV